MTDTPAERLRLQLLEALQKARRSMTTAELREHIGDGVVIEAVYRGLTVLERRGQVRRQRNSGRHVHWTLAATKSPKAKS
ncbi:Fur family transcriptional regulator [Mycobacterium hubeiense]|uniref:Fur family transcriptional regulator n=1 Tax=Mycobacterium hubeiense TaxID=1867256 RepID=UPI000C7ECF2A|nr:Fur family transcriptional regulator [Mycobacterium sp. QGD 101]